MKPLSAFILPLILDNEIFSGFPKIPFSTLPQYQRGSPNRLLEMYLADAAFYFPFPCSRNGPPPLHAKILEKVDRGIVGSLA
jgi:hypothetical protein